MLRLAVDPHPMAVTAEMGFVLASVMIDGSVDPYLRQMSGVLLRQYVKTHWTSVSEQFVEPEVPAEVWSRGGPASRAMLKSGDGSKMLHSSSPVSCR